MPTTSAAAAARVFLLFLFILPRTDAKKGEKQKFWDQAHFA